MAEVSIRIDDVLKVESDRLFRSLGITFSSAVSMFISQAVREQAIPFKVSLHKANDITIASENALSKDWLSPEEDSEWAHL